MAIGFSTPKSGLIFGIEDGLYLIKYCWTGKEPLLSKGGYAFFRFWIIEVSSVSDSVVRNVFTFEVKSTVID